MVNFNAIKERTVQYKNQLSNILLWAVVHLWFLAALGVILSSTSIEAQPLAYVTNFGSNNITVIDTSSNTVNTTINLGGVNGPFGAAVNRAGTFVYVTNQNSGSVSVIDTSNNTVTATIQVGVSPAGVAVNPAGTFVYVTNQSSNS